MQTKRKQTKKRWNETENTEYRHLFRILHKRWNLNWKKFLMNKYENEIKRGWSRPNEEKKKKEIIINLFTATNRNATNRKTDSARSKSRSKAQRSKFINPFEKSALCDLNRSTKAKEQMLIGWRILIYRIELLSKIKKKKWNFLHSEAKETVNNSWTKIKWKNKWTKLMRRSELNILVVGFKCCN